MHKPQTTFDRLVAAMNAYPGRSNAAYGQMIGVSGTRVGQIRRKALKDAVDADSKIAGRTPFARALRQLHLTPTQASERLGYSRSIIHEWAAGTTSRKPPELVRRYLLMALAAHGFEPLDKVYEIGAKNWPDWKPAEKRRPEPVQRDLPPEIRSILPNE